VGVILPLASVALALSLFLTELRRGTWHPRVEEQEDFSQQLIPQHVEFKTGLAEGPAHAVLGKVGDGTGYRCFGADQQVGYTGAFESPGRGLSDRKNGPPG